MADNYSNKIRTATKWSAITNIFSKITPPITNIILARLLAPEAFGVVATITMVITFADIFADAGFQKYLIQHEFEGDEDLYKNANVAFWSNFSISVFLWIIIFIFREKIAALVGSEGYGLHLSIAAFSIPMIAFSSIQQAIYKRDFNFKGLFVPKLIRSLIPLLITVPLAYFFRNCWPLIIGTLAANLSDAVLLTIKSRWKPKFYYSLNLLKQMLSFSIWTLFESLTIWLSGSVDIFIIGTLLTNYYLGLYKTSLITVEQLTSLISTTIVPVLFSSLSRLQNDEVGFREMFYAFQKKCSIILVPLSFGIFLFSSLVTKMLLGKQWLETIPFIGLLGLIQFIRIIICYFSSEVYRSKGEPKISFIVQIVFIALLVPALYFSCNYGFECLYKVRIGTYLAFAVMHLLTLKIRYKFSFISIFKTLLFPLLASIVMYAVGYLLLLVNSNLWMQIIAIIACILVYLGICMLIPDTRNTIKSLIRRNRL